MIRGNVKINGKPPLVHLGVSYTRVFKVKLAGAV